MKLLATLLWALSGGLAPAHAEGAPPDLVVYAYDSFASKGGLGPEIIPLFEKSCGCKVSVLPSGDGGQLLNRVQLDAEAKRKGAHVIVGLDQSTWERAKLLTEPWGDWKPKGLESAVHKIQQGFLPFDYGVFAFMADTKVLAERKLREPRSLNDLLDPSYKRQILLEDPRTSTPGLAFLTFTDSALGSDLMWKWWSSFRGQWLTLSPGWDQAYGLFLKGEAPLVWSYVTSQAYHIEHGEPSRYRAILFTEGNPLQIEGAALVKGAFETSRERDLARAFLEFLLSPEVQTRIPLKNWMYPIMKGTDLPASFKKLPKVETTVSSRANEKLIDAQLKSWGRVIRGGKP